MVGDCFTGLSLQINSFYKSHNHGCWQSENLTFNDDEDDNDDNND